ncbi:MAG TPA: hypothetical protein VFJ46_00135, partial [Xanthobacteraceae bacterium]|nr:hypothetical protein [Xanthobacteraceae bacterium]
MDADDERQVRPSTSRLLDPFRLIVAGSRSGDSRAPHHRCQSLESSAPIDPIVSDHDHVGRTLKSHRRIKLHPSLEDRHRAALLVDRAETELMVGDELACYVLIAKY